MDPVRFGLVGFGAWGGHHAAAIAKTRGARLVAIAARSKATRKTAGDAYPDASILGDYHELAARDDVDVVDIVLPSHLHFDAASAALAAGKHVLLEKPMALSLGDCRRLVEAASDRRLLLAVGHELRLSSLWSEIRRIIDRGGIGRPQYALIELSRNPYRQGAEGWRYDRQRVGSWILEEPIHFFDLARWYFAGAGDPLAVYARANARDADRAELHDNFSAIVDFPHGAYAVVSQTLAAFEHHQSVKLAGSEGALSAYWSGAMDRTRHPDFGLRHFDGKSVETVGLEKITGEVFELEDQMAMLVRAVRGEGELAATGEDGLWSVKLCLAAEESLRQGRPVTMTQLD